MLPFLLIISLFFLWAFGVNLNDILIPHLKRAFGLSDFQSSFIQVAFFGGYFLAAFPAGWTMERIGYKKGILLGLAAVRSGSSAISAGFFLRSVWVLSFCPVCDGVRAEFSGSGRQSLRDHARACRQR